MRWLLILLVSLFFGCATQVAVDLWGGKVAVGSTIADPRISEKQATVDDEGVQVFADKDAMSKQFAEMIEVTLPEIVESAVKAALVSAGIEAVGSLTSGMLSSDSPSNLDIDPGALDSDISVVPE